MKPMQMTQLILDAIINAHQLFINKANELEASNHYNESGDVGDCVREAAEKAWQNADLILGALKRYEMGPK